MVRIDAWLDAIGGTEFLAELRRLEKEMFEADWAEARARLGDLAKASDLARTAEQRRADALVEMARRSATCDTPGQPPKWVLNVMVGYATFWNELAALTGDAGDGGHCPCCTNHHADHDRDPDDGGPDDLGPDDGDPEDRGPDDGDPDDGGPDDGGPEDGDPDDGGPDPDVDRDEHATRDHERNIGTPGERRDDSASEHHVDGPLVPPAASDESAAPSTEPAAPRPLPDWWKAIDLRPGAGLADTRFYDTMCELEDCTPITARTAISLGLAGTIRRVVFGPDSQILDFGNDVDYFHGPLREAVVIRDRFCRDPGCGLPGRDCQIDHRVPRSRGGPTAATNGECKCGTGNRLKGDRMP